MDRSHTLHIIPNGPGAIEWSVHAPIASTQRPLLQLLLGLLLVAAVSVIRVTPGVPCAPRTRTQ